MFLGQQPAEVPDSLAVTRSIDPVRAGQLRIPMRDYDPDRPVVAKDGPARVGVDRTVAIIEGLAPVVAEHEAPIATFRRREVDHRGLVGTELPPAVGHAVARNALERRLLLFVRRNKGVWMLPPPVGEVEEDQG